MNETPPPKYPTVRVGTPMPTDAPATLLHRGQLTTLPGKFDHATATYLLSLFDYQVASRLCDGENFEPLPMNVPQSVRRAVGLVSVVDYHQTDVGPYREWILGLWVVPKGERVPVLNWVNPLSLIFYAVLAGDKGFTSFSPKMILTEPLPTEVGVEHYGIPKELGQVSYKRTQERTLFEVQDSADQWIMRTEVPTTRGFVARCRFLLSLVRAFGVGPCFRSARTKEMLMTVVGSAKLCAKNALLVSKVDPHAEFLVWDGRDCRLTTNPEAQWGKVLQSLGFSPSLICHVPNLAFVLSGPFDQVLGEVTPANKVGFERNGSGVVDVSDPTIRTYSGAVAVITGGASGIGQALGEELARCGAEVILADLQADLAEKVAVGIREAGGKATAVGVDVTDFQAVKTLIEQTTRKAGRLDYLFNNAGIAVIGEARRYEIDDWNRVIDVNLRGVVNGVQAAYPLMCRQGFGHIVNTASIAGLMPLAGLLSYSASKHAVVGLSTSLRVEAATRGVRVSVLCPGPVETAIVDGGKFGKAIDLLPPEVQRRFWEQGRPIAADVFAQAALTAVAKNKAIIVIPWWWKVFWWAYRLSPTLAMVWAKQQFLTYNRLVEESRTAL